MTESKTRRRAVLIGLLIGLPVILFGALPAVWSLADQHLSRGGSSWSSRRPRSSGRPRHARSRSAGPPRRLLRPGVLVADQPRVRQQGLQGRHLRHVRVTITGITAPQASAEHPCTRADFRVRPMRAGVLVLPGDSFTSLVRLGVPSWRWPHLKMLNRPVNQDGCKERHVSRSATSDTECGQGEGHLEARRARRDPAGRARPARPPGGRFGDGVLGRVGKRIGLRRHRHRHGGDAEPGDPDGRTLSRRAGVGGPDGHQPQRLQRPGRFARARHRPGHRRVRRRRRALGMRPGRPSRSRPRPTRARAGPLLPAANLSVTLTNALSMTAAAANACQGASFTVYLAAGP